MRIAGALADLPGADFHYSLLGLARLARQTLNAVQAFTLGNRPDRRGVQDPSVARDKLGWWRVEVGRLFAGIRSIQSPAPCIRS